MKTKEDVISEIKSRLELAQVTHRQERESEHPDIRSKEAAWGKMVAYAKCLRLFSELNVSTEREAIKTFLSDNGKESLTSLLVAYEKRLRKKEDEIGALWEMHIRVVKNYDELVSNHPHP